MVDPQDVAEESGPVEEAAAEGESWQVPDEPQLEVVEEAPAEEAVAEETTPAEVEEEPQVEEPVPWDGNPDTLPDALKATHKEMVRGMNAKYRELAEWKKAQQEEFDRRLEALSQAQQPQEQAPPIPSPDDPEWARKNDERNQYFAKKYAEEILAKNAPAPEQEEALQQMQKRMQEIEAQRQLTRIRAMPGYSPAVENMMEQMISEDPVGIGGMVATENGVDNLFALALNKVTAAQGAVEKAKRAAEAAKRTVSRPSERATKDATPADKYSQSFEEMARETAKEMGIPWR